MRPSAGRTASFRVGKVRGWSMRKPPPTSFCQWQTPTELFAKAEATGHAVGVDRFLDANDAKYLREAWVIGRVGTVVSAPRARLSQTDPPDGYLEIKDVGIIPVEVTERLQERRRRGDEDHSATRVQQERELDAAIDQNSEWLEALIRKKLTGDHNCSPKTVLLVFHNTSLYNFDPARTHAELEAASQLRGKNIVGSMILYEGEVYGRSTLARL